MHWQYLRYVVKHKVYVYRAGRALGVGRWQLIKHDWSKFLPCEWFPYARYFYGDYPKRADVPSEIWMRCNVRTREEVAAEFDRAWLHHQHHNPHHYQYWTLREDSGKVKALSMPMKYLREMLADWHGAGAALGKPDTRAWYLRNREHIVLHPDDRFAVERLLGVPEHERTEE